MSAFAAIFKRDLRLAYAESGGALASLGFFVVSYALFAFAMGAEEHKAMLFPILCALVVFSTLLALSNLFERDEADGTLEQYAMLPLAPELLALAKLLAFISAISLPLVVLAAGIHVAQGLSFTLEMVLRLSLLAFALAAIGTISAALTLLGGRTQLVRSLIALPLMLPVVIFASQDGGTAVLAAMTLVLLPASAFLSGLALKQ